MYAQCDPDGNQYLMLTRLLIFDDVLQLLDTLIRLPNELTEELLCVIVLEDGNFAYYSKTDPLNRLSCLF